jgi:hypothetical protein
MLKKSTKRVAFRHLTFLMLLLIGTIHFLPLILKNVVSVCNYFRRGFFINKNELLHRPRLYSALPGALSRTRQNARQCKLK